MKRAASALTWPQARWVLAAGAAFGLISGASGMMFSIDGPWVNLWLTLVAYIALAILLLPGLAVANSAALRGVPRWLSHAVAGLGASLLAAFAGFAALPQHVLDLPALTLRHYWVSVPPLGMTGVLAALGVMHWVDTRRRADALHEAKLERARIARQSYEARLVALQARVEPAFLFDTLSLVRSLYERDDVQGAKVLDDLIVHLRAALPMGEDTSSSLGVELELARTWLDIARARSDDRLVVAMPEPAAPLDARMPPMVLLPLVQHAASAGGGEARTIVVSAALDGGRVAVRVIAPLAAFEAQEKAPAIAAARERFAALYAGSGTLTLRSVAYDRSEALLDLPYERCGRRPR